MKIIAYHPNSEELEKLCYRLVSEGENLLAFTASAPDFHSLIREQTTRPCLLMVEPPARPIEDYSPLFQDKIYLEPQPQGILELLRRAGYTPQMSLPDWNAACQKAAGELDRQQVLSAAQTFLNRHNPANVTGLENLPLPWLAELPALLSEWMTLRKTTHLLELITELKASSGFLDLEFATRGVFPDVRGLSRLDQLRIWLNLRLKPSRLGNF